MTRGGGAATVGGTGAAVGGFGTVAGAIGFAVGGTSRAAGGAGADEAAVCCLPIMAFSTSPGFEMCDKSILVLIPSGSGRLERAGFG